MKQPLYIIKIGGNIIDDPNRLSTFLSEFSRIDGKKILVHGGGKIATTLAEKLDIKQNIVDGRRITDGETLKIITMVYAGYVNKNIVALLQANGLNAIGLTGADGNAVLAHKRRNAAIDYGFAGDIDRINTDFIQELLEKDMTLVFAPVTHDKKGQLLNTNADTLAQELAKGLSVTYAVTLIYSFEKNGVLLDTLDENSVIKEINPDSYKRLKDDQKIVAGMIPKLDNAFAALNNGVKKVVIGNAIELHSLIAGQAGTTIANE